jgi:predicted nucleotidyltransferase
MVKSGEELAMTDEIKRGLGIDDLLADKREDILRIAEKHGASNVRVYGSVARGEATPESDVDLLVDWDLKRISSWGGAGLDLELEELLGRKVDIASEDELHPRIKANVLHEAVAL